MSLDIASMLVGAGLLGTGALTGAFLAMLVRNPQASRHEPSPYVCGCTHTLAAHDPETNQCHAGVEADEWNDSRGIYVTVIHSCACRQYVGERPLDVEAVLDDFAKKHPMLPDPQNKP